MVALGYVSADRALKGRHCDALRSCIAPFQGSRYAMATNTQGCALGYHMPAFQAEEQNVLRLIDIAA